MGAGPTFPASVTVGQKGVSATIVLEHTSTGPEATQIATVCNAGECAGPSEGITITPSCGSINNVPTCTSPDPDVFGVAPIATLAPGSSCGLPPTQRFDVALVDPASGKLRITPQGGAHVVLGPKGTPSAICEIQLTFDVLKQPAADFFAAQTGIQTLQLVSADMTVNALQGFGRGSSTGTTVEPLPPPPPPPPVAVDVPRRPPAPGPPVAPSSAVYPLISPFPVIRLRGRADRGGVLITLLRIQAPNGTRVTIYCKGRSCRWRKRWRYTTKGVVRARAFEHRLRAGTTLSIYVTKAGFTGKYTRFRIKKNKPPARRDLCARSEGAASVPCPAN